jgi:hypothetical protein
MGFVQIFSVVVTKEKNAVCKYHDLYSNQIAQLFFFVMACGWWMVLLVVYVFTS